MHTRIMELGLKLRDKTPVLEMVKVEKNSKK